jgi:hypothetical protein
MCLSIQNAARLAHPTSKAATPKTKPPWSPVTVTSSTSSPHAMEPKPQKSPSPRQPHKERRQAPQLHSVFC